MPSYRKIPHLVEAVQYKGDNTQEVEGFIGKSLYSLNHILYASAAHFVAFNTEMGPQVLNIDDWVIKDQNLTFFTCRNGLFHQTYEELAV